MDTEENEDSPPVEKKKLRPNFRIESLQYEGGGTEEDELFEGGDGGGTPNWRRRSTMK